MKQVKIRTEIESLFLDELDENCPIFAKKDAGLNGMIISEKDGWILRFNSGTGATGYYHTREKCMKSCIECGYSFFTDI